VCRISKADLPGLAMIESGMPRMIRITEADLEYWDFDVVSITLEDLARLDQSIIRIDPKDLPDIIKIREADLPSDLSYVTTECYHGTSTSAAERIRRQGFRVGSRTAMGAGVYFSVGGMTIAKGYVRSSRPCIVRARVDWGRVAYLDDPKIPKAVSTRSGGARTKAAMELGYTSLLNTSKYSRSKPAVGIVLGKRGTHIRPPRITVIELINPRSGERK